MPVVCLLFPRLKIDLVLRSHPELRRRPVVLVDGPGPDGTVTSRSPEAALLGIHSSMPAKIASSRAPGAIFLPDTESRVRSVLTEIADSIRREGAGVPQIGEDCITVHVGHLVSVARVLAAAGVADSGLTVRTGTGDSAERAFAAARAARAEWVGSRHLTRRRAS